MKEAEWVTCKHTGPVSLNPDPSIPTPISLRFFICKTKPKANLTG